MDWFVREPPHNFQLFSDTSVLGSYCNLNFLATLLDRQTKIPQSDDVGGCRQLPDLQRAVNFVLLGVSGFHRALLEGVV